MQSSRASSSFSRTAGIAGIVLSAFVCPAGVQAEGTGETPAGQIFSGDGIDADSASLSGPSSEATSVQLSGAPAELSVSGVFIDDKGTVATLASTEDLNPDSPLEIDVGGQLRQATFLASDKESGLSLFRVEGVQSKPARFGRSEAMKPGARLYVVSGDGTQVEGRLAGREKGINGFVLSTAYLRIHLARKPESVGGPVYDEEGRVVALLMGASREAEPVGYALPVEMAQKVRRDVDKFGAVRPVWLGFGLENGTTTPEVKTVAPNSPVETAGVRKGDILLSIGEREVASYQDVVDACSYLTVRDPVEFRVLRGLKEETLRVNPGPRPPTKKAPEPGE